MKKSPKKKFLLFVYIFAFIAICFVVENDIMPYSIQDNFDVFDVVPVNGTEFQSEDLEVNGKYAFIYTTVSEKTSLDNKDEYIIIVGRVRGINNNRYEMKSFSPQIDSDVLSNEYVNIFDSPQFEMKRGNSYYGTIYVGTVPIDCKSVEIQGNKATLVEQSFNLNGKKANFYLYYCAIEENEYPSSVSVVCENKNGEKFNIITEKY